MLVPQGEHLPLDADRLLVPLAPVVAGGPQLFQQLPDLLQLGEDAAGAVERGGTGGGALLLNAGFNLA